MEYCDHKFYQGQAFMNARTVPDESWLSSQDWLNQLLGEE